ncbi:hypothetical protein BST27_08615 [Mycobacterium intermedium]|uniref:DUF5666 domain-containing protein n=1 Tax=Mycobacterium intermedium TaxID=28445 RepID=A0A1E3SAV3_MYCIE|nr:hypothetical protein [Mycobacterium intermedium]MCV6967503.1 hypothetical protein [Mycobacterium intermedium]ODQ99290.1 hypothetical protein BHQ20_17415 [Mycobacterium intermedium]OPE49136.1 hypothetical protein BV508_15280 [Mycobacterium intermedium]ORB07746.1 hypothetical protein BST27_08615 [Mycobacterium intermedium]
MTAKHRMTPSMQRTQPRQQRAGWALGIGSASLLCAASLAGLILDAQQANRATEAAAVTVDAPSHARPVSQEGTLIAVSADSITARSADGYTQTYLLTPDTTVIAAGDNQPATAASYFTVNDEVTIVGTMQRGTATATAVAARHLAHGGAQPMDFGF